MAGSNSPGDTNRAFYVEQRRSGRVQDRDLDLPRWNVTLDAIDAAVARYCGTDRAVLSGHGRRAGPAKAVAVELAARLANVSGRAVALHDAIGSAAVVAIHLKSASAFRLQNHAIFY